MVRRRHALLGGLAVLGAAAASAPAIVRATRGALRDGPAELRIATGPAGGVFRELGAALAAALSTRMPGTRVRWLSTDASVENLALLDSRSVDLAFASLDAVTAGLQQGHPGDVTAVARLYDSWMQVFVLDGSPIVAVSQLDGCTVATGAARSGTRFIADRLVEVAGLRLRQLTGTQDAGAAALAAGTADAWITCTGVPTPAVQALSRSVRLRMLPVAPYLQEMTRRFGAAYAIATLPSSTYPGVRGSETVTTPNLLLALPHLPTETVELVTSVLFAELPSIAREHPEANEINVRAGVATMPVRLHPGALRYFRSAKPYV